MKHPVLMVFVILSGVNLGLILDFSGLPPESLSFYWLGFSFAGSIAFGGWSAHLVQRLALHSQLKPYRPIPETIKLYRKNS